MQWELLFFGGHSFIGLTRSSFFASQQTPFLNWPSYSCLGIHVAGMDAWFAAGYIFKLFKKYEKTASVGVMECLSAMAVNGEDGDLLQYRTKWIELISELWRFV